MSQHHQAPVWIEETAQRDYIACIQNMNLAFIIGLFMFDGPVQWQYWTPVCFILTFRLYEVLSRARMFYG